MKRISLFSGAVLALLLATAPASAQDSPWMLEVRVGGSVPTESFVFEPAVRFGGTETSTTLAYVMFDVGIALKF